jgi:hypothetical protein
VCVTADLPHVGLEACWLLWSSRGVQALLDEFRKYSLCCFLDAVIDHREFK